MKKRMTTIGIGLIIALTSPSFTQDFIKGDHKEKAKDLTPEERAQNRTDKMITELGLSKEQAKKVYEINLSYAKSMVPIHDEMKKLKEQAKNLRKKTKLDIDKVLTKEQKEKPKSKKLEHKENVKEMYKAHGSNYDKE